jgi:hypothetical protein
MSIWLDKKYACMLPLTLFSIKNNGKQYANCRCVYCGDSQKSQSLKRGWFLDQGTELSFFCHNCGKAKPFWLFLKEKFPYYYEEYAKESLLEKYGDKPTYKKPEVDLFKDDTVIVNLTKIKDLPKDHRVIKYCDNRKIPYNLIKDYYYSDNFYNWCKEKQPDTFKFDCDDDPRIIFPFLDRDGSCFGLSGRTLAFSEVKYLTIKFDEDKPKVFGLDRFNPHKKGYLVEGQIDSLFLDNCIGAIGALGNVATIAKYCNVYDKHNLVIVPDNERRNKQTCNFIKKNLELGFPVCLWPESIKVKDVNDMRLKLNLTSEQIADIISNNTVSGVKGMLLFNNWRRS